MWDARVSELRWFAAYRQEWIAEMLRVYGFIQRGHLKRMFGLSTPQASHDLQAFNAKNPGVMVYDSREKCYVAAALRDDLEDAVFALRPFAAVAQATIDPRYDPAYVSTPFTFEDCKHALDIVNKHAKET